MAKFTAKGANILVVDDDDDIREIVHILLAREGFTVREAANAEQALRRLDPLPDRKSTRLNSSHNVISRMPSSA